MDGWTRSHSGDACTCSRRAKRMMMSHPGYWTIVTWQDDPLCASYMCFDLGLFHFWMKDGFTIFTLLPGHASARRTVIAFTANLSIRVARLSLVSARNRITNTHSVIDTTDVADGSSAAPGVKLNALLAQLPRFSTKEWKMDVHRCTGWPCRHQYRHIWDQDNSYGRCPCTDPIDGGSFQWEARSPFLCHKQVLSNTGSLEKGVSMEVSSGYEPAVHWSFFGRQAEAFTHFPQASHLASFC